MHWSARVVLFSIVLISHAEAVKPHNIPSVNQNKHITLDVKDLRKFSTVIKWDENGFVELLAVLI
jgi:hypothetical protein